MPSIPFTVDSALLKEIGERLVGNPHVALAELVKNSYDADAPKVSINLNPQKDEIIIDDTGNGMTLQEFIDYWMRIGSTHKVRQKVSRNLQRPLTGSKGIGRLAVQYLAEKMELVTTSEYDPNTELRANVNWDEAVKAGELVEARVNYKLKKSANEFKKGTKIILKGLKHEWKEKQIEGLASEIWWLKPPFKAIKAIQDENIPKDSFIIKFKSQSSELQKSFEQRIDVALDLWNARIIGKNERGKVSLILQFRGKKAKKHELNISNCQLENGTWEIRIFMWQGRQTHDIKVGDARNYFNKWGGVHVYDTGFRLPYHGNPENDWLHVELDHSHRLTSSKLLPEAWQIPLGMQMLPTMSRILGIVHVNTSKEPVLSISLDRERLQESNAYRDLRDMVRFGLDWYAIEEKKRSIDEKQPATMPIKVQKIEEVLTEFKDEIKPEVFNKLKKRIITATEKIQTNSENIVKQVGLVGSLATAGITSVAYQHELKRQFNAIEKVIEDLDKIKVDDEVTKKNLKSVQEKLTFWLNSAKSTNNLFGYFSDTENIQIRKRFSAKKIIEEIKEQLSSLARGIPILTKEFDEKLLLPEASLLEWNAIFQNVLVNAFNSVMDSEIKSIEITSRKKGKYTELLIQDTGSGVDLKKADELFQPFVRKINISPERRALGYGGMGLGLTIVKLVANNIGCEVSFVQPEKNFNTAFLIKWMG